MKRAIKIFIAVLVLLAIVAGAFWLDENPGNVEMTWMGYRIAASASVMVGGLTIVGLVVMLVTMLIAGISGMFRSYGLKRSLAKQEEGIDAVTRAMVLLATGDHKSAVKYVERSARRLGTSPIVNMVRASIASREGDQKKMILNLERMLSAPSTQPLAAMALAADAKATGELEKAASYIEQADKEGTMERGTALVLLDIYHRQKRWPEAESLLARMQRKKVLTKEEGHRFRAILHYLQAGGVAEIADPSALHLKMAYKENPGFIPATNLLARQLFGKQRQALSVIKRGWKTSPHPELAKTFFLLMQNASPRAITLSAKAIAAKSPSHIESMLLLAEAATRTKEWEQARTHLLAASGIQSQSRVYHQLALLEQESGNPHEGMGHWLALAATGKASPMWGCTHCGSSHQEWHAVCNHCDQFATIAWDQFIKNGQRPTLMRNQELLGAAI